MKKKKVKERKVDNTPSLAPPPRRQLQLSPGGVRAAAQRGLPPGAVVPPDVADRRGVVGELLAGRGRHPLQGDPRGDHAPHRLFRVHVLQG